MNKYVVAFVLIIIAGLAISAAWIYYPTFNQNPAQTPESSADKPGLVIQDLVEGEGPMITEEDTDALFQFKYTGKLSDGTVFDSSGDVPYFYRLGQNQKIAGWDKGLIGMKVGGKRLIIISPELAYGESGAGLVPPNSTVVFEIEFITEAHIDTPGDMKNGGLPPL